MRFGSVQSLRERLERQQHAFVPALVRMHGRERRELGPPPARRFRRPGDRVAQILCDSAQRSRSFARGPLTDRGGGCLAEQAAAHLVADVQHPAVREVQIQRHAVAAQRDCRP